MHLLESFSLSFPLGSHTMSMHCGSIPDRFRRNSQIHPGTYYLERGCLEVHYNVASRARPELNVVDEGFVFLSGGSEEYDNDVVRENIPEEGFDMEAVLTDIFTSVYCYDHREFDGLSPSDQRAIDKNKQITICVGADPYLLSQKMQDKIAELMTNL